MVFPDRIVSFTFCVTDGEFEFGEFLSLTTAIKTKSEQTRCDKRKQQCFFLLGLYLKAAKGLDVHFCSFVFKNHINMTLSSCMNHGEKSSAP